MSTKDPPDTRSARITTSTLMDDLLMGQPSGRLPRKSDRVHVEELMQMSRPRFDKKHPSVWLIVVVETEEITPDAQNDLKRGFQEFLQAGGTKVVLVTKDVKIERLMKLQLQLAGVKDVEISHTVDAGSRICSAFRDAVRKAATPTR